MNATQLEFRASGAGASQCDLILARLKETPGAWVPMTELYAVSHAFAVHSRVADLRKRGAGLFSIDQKNERQPDGTIHSFYKLEYSDQP